MPRSSRTPDAEFRARARAAMGYIDISPKQLADRLGESVNTVNNWFRHSGTFPQPRREQVIRAVTGGAGLQEAFFDADLDRLDEIPLTSAQAFTLTAEEAVGQPLANGERRRGPGRRAGDRR